MSFELVRYHPKLSDDKQFVLLSPPVDETEEDKRLFAEICDELNIEIKENTLALKDYRRLYERVSRVQLQDDLIPKDLHDAAYYVFEHYLQYPYKTEDIFWDITDNYMRFYDTNHRIIEIPRPNHGLAHSLRVASYIPLIIQHVKDHLDPKFIQYYENYTPKKIRMLQLCALFSVVGRKDETGFGTELPGASDIYQGYRKRSAEAFEEYCRLHQDELDLTESEIRHYSTVVEKMGDPKVYSFDSFTLEQLERNAEGYKLIFVQDETQLEAIQKQIRDENNTKVKPIIVVGDDNKRIAYIYEDGDFKTKECIISDDILKDELFVINDRHELIVNSNSVSLAEKIYHSIDPSANVSDLDFVYTSLSETTLDNLFLHQAHCMDLYRCRDKIDEMLESDKNILKKMIKTFCVDGETEIEEYEKLITRPLETIIATGDRIIDAPITIDGKKDRSHKDYDTNIFQVANTNPDFTISRINSLSPRKRYSAEGVLQGPRQKSKATLELEKLIHALLKPDAHYDVNYNKTFDEIEIIIDGNIFNLTKILHHNPDFEQLSLSPEQLNVFAEMRKNLKLSPLIESINDIPTEEDYRYFDPQNKHEHLHYGEKLAITSYTTIVNYKKINYLLRNGALPEEDVGLAAEAILIAAVASHGLAKEPQPSAQFSSNELQILARKEVYDPYVRDQRVKDIKSGKLTIQRGFFSTSVNPNPELHNVVYDVTVQTQQPKAKNPIGKSVRELSRHPREDEILFPPNTQFQFRLTGDGTTFEAIPYRSIQDDSADSYSSDVMKMRYELMKTRDKLFDLKTKLIGNIIYAFNGFIQGFDKTITNFDLLSSEEQKLQFQKLNYELNALIEYVALTPFAENIAMMQEAKDDIARIGSSFVEPLGSPDPSWISTICYAAMAGDIEAIKQLQKNQSIDISQKYYKGYTLLHFAAYIGHAELVKFLIEVGVPLDQENDDGDSALALAILGNNPDLVNILLDRKANTIKSNPYNNKTVYHYAEEMGNEMLQIFYNKDKENLPLLLANLKDNSSDLKLLSSLITIASINHDNETMHMLIDKWNELNQRSLAEYIYKTMDMAKIIELIELNVSLDEEGNTLLHYLVLNDVPFEWFHNIQKEIARRRGVLNSLNTNNAGITPLYLCAKKAYSSGNENAEKILFLLFEEMNYMSQRELIAWLGKPEIEDEIKFYLLRIAINNNSYEIIRTIKSSRLILNHSHAHLIYSVIHDERSRRFIKLIDQMIPESERESIYADVIKYCRSAGDYTKLLKLSMSNSVDSITKSILDQISEDESLLEILHIAVNQGYLKVVEAYLKRYPEQINQEDYFGWTPLRYAINKNDIEMIKLLIANNVMIDIDSLDIASRHPDIMKLFYRHIRTQTPDVLIDFIQTASVQHRDILNAIYKIAKAENDTDILKVFSGEIFHLQPNEALSMNLHDFKMRCTLNLVGINWLDIVINMAEELEKNRSKGFYQDVNINNFTINPLTLEVRLVAASEDVNGASDVHALVKSIALLFDLSEDPDFKNTSYFIDYFTRTELLDLLKSTMDENSENALSLRQFIDELYKIHRNLVAADNTVTFVIMNVDDYLKSKSNEEEHHKFIAQLKKHQKVVLVDTINRDASVYEMIQRELFDSSILVHNDIFIADSPKRAIENAKFIIENDYKKKGYFPDIQVIDADGKIISSKYKKPAKLGASDFIEEDIEIYEKIKYSFNECDLINIVNFDAEQNIVSDTVQLVTTERVEEYKEILNNLEDDENKLKLDRLFAALALNNVLTDFINKLGDDPQVVYPILKMALNSDNSNIQTSVFRYFNHFVISLVNSLDHSASNDGLKCEILNLAIKEDDKTVRDILLTQDQDSIIAMLNIATNKKMWDVAVALLITLNDLNRLPLNITKELKHNLEYLNERFISNLDHLDNDKKFEILTKFKAKENALGILFDEKSQKNVPATKKTGLFDKSHYKEKEAEKTYYDNIISYYSEVIDKQGELKKNFG